MGMSGQRHAPASLCPRERIPVAHCTGGWVSTRAGLDIKARGKDLRLCRDRTPIVQSVDRQYTDRAPGLPILGCRDSFIFIFLCSITCSSSLYKMTCTETWLRNQILDALLDEALKVLISYWSSLMVQRFNSNNCMQDILFWFPNRSISRHKTW
jgi:hypothetical protein